MINIIIWDEKKYAQRILKTKRYQTLKFQGKERRALARYMKYDLGYNETQTRECLNSIRSKRQEMFDKDVWDSVISKLLDKFDDYDYMRDITVNISKTEIDIILNQPTLELRNLLFVLTVYFKWAVNSNERVCQRKDGVWVKNADLDCCKIAGLDKLRKFDRYKLFYILEKETNVYKSDFIRKYNEIFTLTFLDDNEPAIIIDNYTEVLAHLENYIDSSKCCNCSICGDLIYKTVHNKIMCNNCRSDRKR